MKNAIAADTGRRLAALVSVIDSRNSFQLARVCTARCGAAAVVLVDVFASHVGSTYTTKVLVHRLDLRALEIGHTLPAGSKPGAVVVDGRSVPNAAVRETNRGVEVTVPVSGNGPHTLTVTIA